MLSDLGYLIASEYFIYQVRMKRGHEITTMAGDLPNYFQDLPQNSFADYFVPITDTLHFGICCLIEYVEAVIHNIVNSSIDQ